MTQFTVTQIRSGIGGTRNQRETLRTLGLHRIGQSVVVNDRPEIRGMVDMVAHLVRVEDAVATGAAAGSTNSKKEG